MVHQLLFHFHEIATKHHTGRLQRPQKHSDFLHWQNLSAYQSGFLNRCHPENLNILQKKLKERYMLPIEFFSFTSPEKIYSANYNTHLNKNLALYENNKKKGDVQKVQLAVVELVETTIFSAMVISTGGS